MRNKFVQTENVMRTVTALAALEESARVSPGHGLALIDGRTGTGKTRTVEWFAVQNRQAVYLRSHKEWSPTWMVEDVALALGLSSKSIMRLNMRQLISELRRRPRMLILDEGDRVIRREALLETVRDIHDFTGAPIVLIAEGHGKEMLARKSDRAWRRVSQVVDFTPLTVADVQMMALDLADLEIPKPLAELIHRDSKSGQFGEVVVNLEKVEALVKANPGSGVTTRVVEMALRARKAAGAG